MAKGAPPTSVRDALSEAHAAIASAKTAPDAGPLMPVLQQLDQVLVGIIQTGHAQQGPQGAPPPGGAPGQMPPQGRPGQAPGMGGAPGPAARQMPNAGGQGLFPSSPQPNVDELRALIGNRAGM